MSWLTNRQQMNQHTPQPSQPSQPSLPISGLSQNKLFAELFEDWSLINHWPTLLLIFRLVKPFQRKYLRPANRYKSYNRLADRSWIIIDPHCKNGISSVTTARRLQCTWCCIARLTRLSRGSEMRSFGKLKPITLTGTTILSIIQ